MPVDRHPRRAFHTPQRQPPALSGARRAAQPRAGARFLAFGRTLRCFVNHFHACATRHAARLAGFGRTLRRFAVCFCADAARRAARFVGFGRGESGLIGQRHAGAVDAFAGEVRSDERLPAAGRGGAKRAVSGASRYAVYIDEGFARNLQGERIDFLSPQDGIRLGFRFGKPVFAKQEEFALAGREGMNAALHAERPSGRGIEPHRNARLREAHVRAHNLIAFVEHKHERFPTGQRARTRAQRRASAMYAELRSRVQKRVAVGKLAAGNTVCSRVRFSQSVPAELFAGAGTIAVCAGLHSRARRKRVAAGKLAGTAAVYAGFRSRARRKRFAAAKLAGAAAVCAGLHSRARHKRVAAEKLAEVNAVCGGFHGRVRFPKRVSIEPFTSAGDGVCRHIPIEPLTDAGAIVVRGGLRSCARISKREFVADAGAVHDRLHGRIHAAELFTKRVRKRRAARDEHGFIAREPQRERVSVAGGHAQTLLVENVEIDLRALKSLSQPFEAVDGVFRAGSARPDVARRKIQRRAGCGRAQLHQPRRAGGEVVQPAQVEEARHFLHVLRPLHERQRVFRRVGQAHEVEHVDAARELVQDHEPRQLSRQARAVHAEALGHGQRSACLRRRGGREALEKAVALVAGGLAVLRNVDLPPDHVHARHVEFAQLLKHRAVAVRHAAVGHVVDVQMPREANAVSPAPVVNRPHVIRPEQLALQRAVVLAGARVHAGSVLAQAEKRGQMVAQVVAEARKEFFGEAIRPREAPGARLVGEHERDTWKQIA